ncbi:MAG: hypothetical protein JWP45_2797 [Mucilaginibacter sp.]|nr:hypothetical protein [Mucilaginibacter sp.]
MTLPAAEKKWLEERLKTYQIKYREIYYEILDHVILSVEQKRAAGDSTDISILFQQVVDGHFGGSQGIKELVVKYEYLYKQSIKKLWMQSLRHYVTWQMLVFTIAALLLSLTLPNVEPVKLWLVIGCTLMACSPIVYAYFSLQGRVVKSIKGKQSFLKKHIMAMASAPASFFITFIFFFLPWRLYESLPPVVFMAVIMAFVFFNLASIHFCRQFTTLDPIAE